VLLATAVLAALAAPASAQRQFDELRKQGLPPDVDLTYAMSAGDVDGDGDVDLVFGNYLDQEHLLVYRTQIGRQNRLYLNDGAGVYTDATTARLPVDRDFTRAVALGDVDADGDLDLVIGNAVREDRLYLNDGTGT